MPRVLIIEDSSIVRRLIRAYLETDGYTVVEAESGPQGVQLAAAVMPDVIILDLVMPDVDGVKTLRLLRQGGSIIPIIVVTAHIHRDVRKHCIELGAHAFISKPFTRDEICIAVRNALTPLSQ